jgi:hypothetical protein
MSSSYGLVSHKGKLMTAEERDALGAKELEEFFTPASNSAAASAHLPKLPVAKEGPRIERLVRKEIKLPEVKEVKPVEESYVAKLKRRVGPTLYSSAYNRELPPATFTNKFVEVKPSPVHGRGLFTKTELFKNMKIADYVGETMTVKQYYEKYTPEQRHYFYSAKPIHKIIDGYKYKTVNPSHYMNESKHPNSALRKFGVVITADEVKKNKELFLKYPDKYHREYKL